MDIAGASALNPGGDASSPDPSSIVIVGGGFSGAALAYHLLQQDSQLRFTLVERGPQLGRGIAYAAQHPALRLNVRAANMSLDPSQPAAFVQYARAHVGPAIETQAFLPRSLFGSFVEASLEDARRGGSGQLRVVRGEAVAVEANGVRLADGRMIAGARVVLATGITTQRGGLVLPEDPRIVDAWDEAACCCAADGGGRTLLIGAGLSALDVLTLYEATNPQHEVLVLSRHGLLPRPHAAVSGKFEIPARLGPAPRELGALLRWGRSVVAAAEEAGASWQHALDALRPQLPRLWQGLSPRDRLRFMRRVRPYWEVLRHRAPPEVLEKLEARRARGTLRVLAGQVLHCSATPAALELTIRLRGGARVVERVQHVVRAVGPAVELDTQSSPLMAALFRDGLAASDPTGLGIATGDCGRVIEANGRPSDRLFALGQLCRATRWETTSVPEIVRDAVSLAQLLATQAPHPYLT